MLVGHLEEVAGAFAALWNAPGKKLRKRTRRRLMAAMAIDQRGLLALNLLKREFAEPPPGGLRKTFLETVRNDWAFHYRDDVYRSALRNAPVDSTLLIADAPGLSRHLVTDEMASRAMQLAAGGTPEAYDDALRRTLELAGAIGQVTDRIVLGLLGRTGIKFSSRPVRLTLERALSTGAREAALRRRLAAGGGNRDGTG
jgi:hypothetical protein